MLNQDQHPPQGMMGYRAVSGFIQKPRLTKHTLVEGKYILWIKKGCMIYSSFHFYFNYVSTTSEEIPPLVEVTSLIFARKKNPKNVF